MFFFKKKTHIRSKNFAYTDVGVFQWSIREIAKMKLPHLARAQKWICKSQ